MKNFCEDLFFFFFGDRLKNFCEDLFFFFLESTCACVLGPWPWPRAFLSLASRVSVLGKAVLGLGLGLGFFLCPWPRALCPRLHLCLGDLPTKTKKVFSQAETQFFARSHISSMTNCHHQYHWGKGGLFLFLEQKSASKVLKTGYFAYSSGQWGGCSLYATV